MTNDSGGDIFGAGVFGRVEEVRSYHPPVRSYHPGVFGRVEEVRSYDPPVRSYHP